MCRLVFAFFMLQSVAGSLTVGTTPVMVTDSFSYDGSYDPYTATPPAGQSRWDAAGGTLSPVPNSPEPGLAVFCDEQTGARLTVLAAHTEAAFIAEPHLFEWEYEFRMNVISTGSPLSFFGVRDEGGSGKQVMFAFARDNSSLFYSDGSGNILGANVHNDAEGNLKDKFHRYRVVKAQVGGVMKVRFYIDSVLEDERDYDSLPGDTSTSNGFGFYSSTPGTVSLIMDEMRFGPTSANNPIPYSGAENVALDTDLSWNAPEGSSLDGPLTYNVYFGRDKSLVASGDASVLKGEQAETSYVLPDLDKFTTYYWRVDVVDRNKGVIEGPVWSFTTVSQRASNPNPADGVVAANAVLSWIVGAGFDPNAGDLHRVYLGTDQTLVTNGDASVFQGNQTESTFDPDLDWETIYFWRIDETIGGTTYTGDVWSFTVGTPICDPVLSADLTGDCVVNLEDFADVASQWQQFRVFQPPEPDKRNIATGYVIPDEGYCDQPYVIITNDGHWLCVITTGAGHEGQGGQHIVSAISKDKGKTWSKPIDIEPADGPVASWAMPLITPSGRIYVFYNYNDVGITDRRADTLGSYMYKYSDDRARTWSQNRYRLPMRVTECDRNNDWEGAIQIFWGIGKPIVHDNTMYFAFTKIGKYMLDQSEGWIFRSDNILSEMDPNKIDWLMLPDGEFGIRSPTLGKIQAEHSIVALGDGSLYVMYRTTTGSPAHAYSRDGGHTWTEPVPATYTPGGRKFKNPRACPRIWKTKNGKYLFWFHNNGLTSFTGRNPAWISGGVEKDGYIQWSQPEILLYDLNTNRRISYPDLIEQDGRYWVTETQKSIARIHEIDSKLLEGLWNQWDANSVAEGYALSVDADKLKTLTKVRMPPLPDLSQERGFSIDLWIRFNSLAGGQVILDQYDTKGIKLSTTGKGTIKIELKDGSHTASWDCDQGLLQADKLHHVVVTVDGSPDIITFVVDGILCDGGEYRQYGWTWFTHEMTDVSSRAKLQIAPSLDGCLESLRIYPRYLRTSEAVGNYHAGI